MLWVVLIVMVILLATLTMGQTLKGIVIYVPVDQYDPEVIEKNLTIATVDGTVPRMRIIETSDMHIVYVPMDCGGCVTVNNEGGEMTGTVVETNNNSVRTQKRIKSHKKYFIEMGK
jgi:hypothetical protein